MAGAFDDLIAQYGRQQQEAPKLRTGWHMVDGEARPIPGTPDYEKDLARDAMRKEMADRASYLARLARQLQDRTVGVWEGLRGGWQPTAGTLGSVLSLVPGTAAANVSADIDTLRANIGFDELSKMRQASPTGGALGNVSEKEIGFLQSVAANLSQRQTPEQLRRNLARVEQIYARRAAELGGNPPVSPPRAERNRPSRDEVEAALARNR